MCICVFMCGGVLDTKRHIDSGFFFFFGLHRNLLGIPIW